MHIKPCHKVSVGALSALLLAFFITLFSSLALADEPQRQCVRTARTCAENLPDGTCARWENTYRCLKTTAEAGACATVAKENACEAQPPRCLEEVDDVCLKKSVPLKCTSRITKTPSGAKLSTPVVTPTRVLETKADITTPVGPTCTLTRTECLDSSPRQVPIANAPDLFETVEGVCWKKTETYRCTGVPGDAETASSPACQTLAAAGCEAIEPVHCTKTDANGACLAYGATYRCQSQPSGDGISAGDVHPEDPVTVVGEWNKEECARKEATLKDNAWQCQKTTRCTKKDEATGECVEEVSDWHCEKALPGNCESLAPLKSDPACTNVEALTDSSWQRALVGADETLVCLNTNTQPLPLPEGAAPLLKVTELVPTWTLVGGELTPLTKTPLGEAYTNCSEVSRRCTAGPGWRVVDGRLVYRACWEETIEKRCLTNGGVAECAALEQKGCELIKTTCPKGEANCPNPTRTYRCRTKGTSYNIGTKCDGEDCLGDLCRPSTNLQDPELVNSLVQLELGRQLASYGDVPSNTFFKSEGLKCRDRKGASSCCAREVRSEASNVAFGQAVIFAGQAISEGIKYVGSPFVYDALAWSPKTETLLNHFYGDATSGAYSPSFSYWGLTATYSAGAGWSFSFSPSGFLATAALTAYDRWSACTAEDAKVSLAKGERLCHYVGERCAKKTPGLGCTERHQVYVCFNSRLSKTINEAAHQQLGLSWGTPEASIARGLTMEEIEKLDFTQIDFTDFVNDVMKSVTNRKGEDPTLAAKNAAERIRQMVAGEISRWAPTRKATGTVPTATTPTHPKGK